MIVLVTCLARDMLASDIKMNRNKQENKNKTIFNPEQITSHIIYYYCSAALR